MSSYDLLARHASTVVHCGVNGCIGMLGGFALITTRMRQSADLMEVPSLEKVAI